MRPNPDFLCSKRVLLTGHHGFKGAWLAICLNRLGAKVTGISLTPATTRVPLDCPAVESALRGYGDWSHSELATDLCRNQIVDYPNMMS